MNNTILVADDSPTELRLVLSALGKKGYTIVTATDGDDALEQARKHQPRLAILDIIMPKKNGFQVTRQLKTEAETSAMKVLLLSSKDQDSDKFWGMKQGATEYLTKPFEPTNLLATIRRHV
jgi:twitching motility two-component system response regulator PilH